MLVAERRQKIVEVVNRRESVRVAELSKLFQVTEETIRRDLMQLELERKLKRSHGGAVSIATGTEVPYAKRKVTNVTAKREIAQEALKRIKEGERIILDASTTAWYMANMLPDMPLTVVTNSIKIVMELSKKNNIKVISTGGTLLPQSLSFVGPLAERSLQSYYVDKTFLSCKGLHLERGLSESNELQALVKQQMIRSSNDVYVMIDHSKFGVQSFMQIARLEEVAHIITDSQTDATIIQRLQEQQIDIEQARKEE
jgi:DeoR family fructose operon transcriptional repressor